MFGDLVPNDPDNPTVDQFRKVMNRATATMTNAGKWKGALVRLYVQPFVNLPSTLSNGSDGYITLPRHYLGVLGMRYGCIPSPVFGEWHNFCESGPGFVDPNLPTLGILIDQGDGHPTQRFIPRGISPVPTLEVHISAPTDAGKTVRIFGLDENGLEIFSPDGAGFTITTAYPYSVASGQPVSVVTGIQGPVLTEPFFTGNWQLWQNQNGALYQLGQYQPTERFPCYHRYLCGNLTQNFTNPPGPLAISILAQRRWVELNADSDWVIPGDIDAIGYAIAAENHKAALRYDKEAIAWNSCFKRLNEEARAARAGARVDAEISGQGGFGAGGWGFGFGGGPLPNLI